MSDIQTHQEEAYKIAGNLHEMAEQITKAAERKEWTEAADAALGVCRCMATMIRVWMSLASRR